MSDSGHHPFSDAEINQQALANASSLPYLMVALANEFGHTPEEAAALAGKILAPGWSRFAGLGADALVRQMALSLVCCGGEMVSLTGNSAIAEAQITGAPNEEEAEFFGITRDEADRFCAAFAPMAALLGFSYAWRREGPLMILTVQVLKPRL